MINSWLARPVIRSLSLRIEQRFAGRDDLDGVEEHLIVAAVLCLLYGMALWRRSRGSGPAGARLLLLAPLGRRAAARLSATLAAGPGRSSWRALAALGRWR
jgi:hypothetical protein